MIRILLLSALLAAPSSAQGRKNVMETIAAALASDQGYDAAGRDRLLAAIKTRFADYGLQVVNESRKNAVPVVLHVITEGSFDEAPAERVAEVAFAAYQAMSRGADPEVVEGIALYGYRKKIPGDRLATWANGYRHLTENRVPGDVAADLVRVAMEKDLPDSDFNILKWAMVDASKKGHDPKDYATYLFGHVLEGKGPGRVAGDAALDFAKAKKERRRVALPAYEGVFTKTVAAAPPASVQPPVEAPSAQSATPEAPSSETPIAEETSSVESRPSPRPSGKSPAYATKPAGSAAKPAASAPKIARAVAPGAAPAAVVAEKDHETAPLSRKLTEIWPGLEGSAQSYLGTPYVWGGTTHKGIDCSAFTQNSYGENKVKIPRVSRDQWKAGDKVDASLRDGDLLFFNTMGVGVSHVGMVVDAKKNRFMHASSSKGVTYADLDKNYYKQRYLGARRVVP
ncbi:MAG: hypothetical protein A2V88_03800 [Elusimicrobia bacterium RBG_16_66_12]|nr:MAG: hypothetical protein A2V88_03800 [Elusimicrobia bacterium RBG_16_66_12]